MTNLDVVLRHFESPDDVRVFEIGLLQSLGADH
jgi:hypothetical protein